MIIDNAPTLMGVPVLSRGEEMIGGNGRSIGWAYLIEALARSAVAMGTIAGRCARRSSTTGRGEPRPALVLAVFKDRVDQHLRQSDQQPYRPRHTSHLRQTIEMLPAAERVRFVGLLSGPRSWPESDRVSPTEKTLQEEQVLEFPGIWPLLWLVLRPFVP